MAWERAVAAQPEAAQAEAVKAEAALAGAAQAQAARVEAPPAGTAPAGAAPAGAARAATGRTGDNTASWSAFLAMAFLVVGLVGAFGTYASQIPWQRLSIREAALDRLAADPAASPDGEVFGEDAPRLAAAASAGSSALAAAIVSQRVADRARFRDEAADIGRRLQVLIGVFTAVGMLFGAIVVGLARKPAV